LCKAAAKGARVAVLVPFEIDQFAGPVLKGPIKSPPGLTFSPQRFDFVDFA
jgi:hypothetical protein